MRWSTLIAVVALALSCCGSAVRAQTVGTSGADDLVLAAGGATKTTVVVSPDAGTWEKQAANDLVKYIEMMTGAKPVLANTAESVAAAMNATTPVLFVGAPALKAEPDLQKALTKVAKKEPVLRADAIAVLRKGNRVYLAGTNDDAHYYAASWLLQQWGCRWYLPSDFGECIPAHPTLKVGRINYAYAPPFEARGYWNAWNGEQSDRPAFLHRNMMNDIGVPNGHHPGLADYTAELVPPGKGVLNVPIAEEKTAQHVAGKVKEMFAKGQSFSLGMEDGIYESDSAKDKEIQAGLYDKYFLTPVLTDNFMTLYNSVARQLLKEYPDSKAKIGFLAYSNITLPPQRDIIAEKPLVAYLAPIDIDPNHGMDSPLSPPKQEYRDMMYRWSEVMQGRVIIYDYDQGMLVWRDIPNPSQQAFRQDVKHYRDAGILGVATESRNAIGTIFLNLYFRGQLMWNPDADVDAMHTEFYQKFYGPAAAPMANYWNAIFKAWNDTVATEHEFFVAPAVYTPQLIEDLRKHLKAAEAITNNIPATRDAPKYKDRMKFTRLSFEVLDNYMAMVRAAASEADYKAAVAAGQRGLAARLELAKMNSNFTTRVVEPVPESEANGAAWWPGEVKQYRDLLAFTDGTKGTLIAKLPLEWAFHRDPNDTGLARAWARKPVDLAYWKANGKNINVLNRKDYPISQWEMLRTDLYMQGQGVRHPDGQSFTGHAWYRTEVALKPEQAKDKVRLRFPGVFNECWLYVNGSLVAHREQKPMWWINDYAFEWDVDLSGHVKAGTNTITLRLHNPHHFGGIFRRPFLYKPAA